MINWLTKISSTFVTINDKNSPTPMWDFSTGCFFILHHCELNIFWFWYLGSFKTSTWSFGDSCQVSVAVLHKIEASCIEWGYCMWLELCFLSFHVDAFCATVFLFFCFVFKIHIFPLLILKFVVSYCTLSRIMWKKTPCNWGFSHRSNFKTNRLVSHTRKS